MKQVYGPRSSGRNTIDYEAAIWQKSPSGCLDLRSIGVDVLQVRSEAIDPGAGIIIEEKGPVLQCIEIGDCSELPGTITERAEAKAEPARMIVELDVAYVLWFEDGPSIVRGLGNV